MKRLVFASLFLLVILMAIGGVSAAPACGLANDNQLIMKLSGTTNAHGEAWNSAGSYGVEICYNTLFGKEYGGPFYHSNLGNNAVLKLSGTTNAHGEGPAGTNYGTGVYYGDLACTLRNTACSAGEVEVLRLSGTTNAHLAIAGTSAYSQRICCSSAFAAVNRECNLPSDCADDGNECTSAICRVGVCEYNPLSDGTLCTGGSCRGGVCVPLPPTCTDECTPIETKECSGNGYRECGNFDTADSCLEWSDVTACPAAPVCQTASCSNGCVNSNLPDGQQPGCNTGNMECRSGQCVDTTQPCTLTNAYWSLTGTAGSPAPDYTEVLEGTSVYLFVEGRNCDASDSVSFAIREQDCILGICGQSGVLFTPSSITFSSNPNKGVWQAVWTDDGIINVDDPEYFFYATHSYTGGSSSVSSDRLIVKKAPACTTAAQCADSNMCDGVESCVNNICQEGTPVVCEDNNECTTNSCNPASGACVFNPVSNGVSCNSGAGTCQSGSCVISGTCTTDAGCENNNKCDGLSTCNVATGECRPGTPLNCEDGNVCIVNTCDPLLGCTGSPLVCSDNNQCTDDTCDSTTIGGCVFTPKSDGAVCSFGTCQSGVCKCQSNADCNDNNQCTADSCDLTTGQCSHPTISCSDGKECTTDSCNPASGCSNSPRTGDCGTGGTCDDGGQCIQPIDAYWANETGARITESNRLVFVGDKVKVSAQTRGLTGMIDFVIKDQDGEMGGLDDDTIRSFDDKLIDAETGIASAIWLIDETDIRKANGLFENNEFDDGHAELYIIASASGVPDDESDILLVSPEDRFDNDVRGCPRFTDASTCDASFDYDPYDSNYDNCGEPDANSCTIECSCKWIAEGGGQCALDKQVEDSPCDDGGYDPNNGGDGWECIIHNAEFRDCIDGFRKIITAVTPISNPPAGQCVAEEKQIRCGRAVVQLPFFGSMQFVLSLIAIAILYLLMFGRRKN